MTHVDSAIQAHQAAVNLRGYDTTVPQLLRGRIYDLLYTPTDEERELLEQALLGEEGDPR